uniref:Cytosolic carboxypeptidase N-terminal domain-containing protein n=1 Tax=Podarcis muralis TaxID=64176 RepID=A0A670IB83_PODMU
MVTSGQRLAEGGGGNEGMKTNMAERSKTAETGSDIGIDEIITGNLNKCTAVPPGYFGQPKKGHLIFDACFESGNLGRVDYITEFEYDLFIRPDTCNPRFRVWFNFTVENVKESQASAQGVTFTADLLSPWEERRRLGSTDRRHTTKLILWRS